MSRLLPFIALLLLIQPSGAETATVGAHAGGSDADPPAEIQIIVDSDRDGLTDAQEATLGTDPGNPDSDGDGLTDKAEIDAGTDPLDNQFTTNPDGVGLINSGGVNLANNLRAVWGFENEVGSQFTDASGNGYHLTINETDPEQIEQGGPSSGPVSRSVAISTGGYLRAAPNVIAGKIQATMAFWVNLPTITPSGSALSHFTPIFSLETTSGSTVSLTYLLQRPNLFSNWFPRIVFATGLPGSFSGSSHIVYLVNPAVLRLDDGEWHHVVVSIDTQRNVSVQIDGVSDAPAQGVTFYGFSGITGANALLGRYFAANTTLPFNGELDQFLLYDRALTENERLALWNYDADRDGEPNREELANGTDPFLYEPDVDRDGLTNDEETAGVAVFDGRTIPFGSTDPGYFDSDGDLFDDYWEAKYFRPGFVDPNNGSVPVDDNDDDNDGVTNWEELLNGTRPVAQDLDGSGTIDQDEEDAAQDTDGDGIWDKDEADFGSDPLDGTEVPLDPSAFYGDENLGSYAPIGDLGVVLKAGDQDSPFVYAQVGDPSGSHSERWRLLIGDKQLVAQDFGDLSDGDPATSPAREKTRFALYSTDFHEITVKHVGTDPAKTPDFDYWATVEPGPQSPFILCDLEGLLSDPTGNPPDDYFEQDDFPNPDSYWKYKTAYLVPLDNYSWATSFSGDDAVGPRYRKVGVNGRPMPDEKPHQEDESDLPDEETYIDAFNLSLHHDTTFHYTPLGSSDLVLQATASTAETGFSSRSGLRPHERFDLPFGIGWTSNLCSYVEVIETIGGEAVDPVTVNVVDEAGRPQRFGTVDFKNFFPWPSTRVDKKTYLNKLTRNGASFTLEKKFGNTLTFTQCKTWFMYSTDRIEGSTQVRRHTYWRLAEARDRYGVRLHYDYDEPGVPNEVSLIPHQISSPDRPNQFLVINRTADYRRVASITDSRGNTTEFTYETAAPLTFTGLDADNQPISAQAPAPRLTGVTYADQTTTAYGYDGGLEKEVDDSDPQNVRVTWHYHANVDAITDKRGNTHGFTYAFDQSKQYWDSYVNGTRTAIDLDRLPADVKAWVEEQIEHRNDDDQNHGSWKTMYGMPRRVTEVTLPGTLGSASFDPQGAMRFGQTVSFTTLPSTTVTDAAGKTTVYEFKDMAAEIVDVDATSKSVSAEWMVYYLTSVIHHGALEGQSGHLGKETYTFDKASGLSLASATDLSGNPTTWEYGNDLPAQPHGLGKDAASTTMTKWADPTAKVDALTRREEYTYGAFRVMDNITDVHGTITAFTVDGLGRRTFKNVSGAAGSLLQERYDYRNQRFKAFQTGRTTLAFNPVSGQEWESNLVAAYLPDDRGRLWREIVDPDGLKLTTEHTYDLNNNRTSTLDPRGNRTGFTYDKLNRLTLVTYPGAGATKEIWYDRNGNKAAEIDEEEHITIFHYDALNRLVKTIRDMDGEGLPTRTGADGEKIVEEANKGTATGTDLVTELLYDSVNNLTHQIDPNGTVTRTFHDAIQRPTHVFTGLTLAEADAGLAACTAAAAASREKSHTEFAYDPAKNTGGSAFDSSAFKPTTVTRHDAVLTAAGEATLETNAEFDDLYRPIRTETEYEPDDFAVTTTAYGTIAAGKESLESTTTVEPGGANAKATRTVMDGLRRTIEVTDGVGGTIPATTQTVWSSTGLVWKTIDPLNRETETEYDTAGRPVAVWQPDPDPVGDGKVDRNTPNDPLLGSPRTQTAYDKNGNVTVTINPLGYRWEYEYDARNRRTLERQPTVTETEIVNGQPEERPLDNPLIRTAYDGVGNVIAVTDARGHITRSFHDQANRVTDVLTNPVNGQPSDNLQNPGSNDIRVQTAYDANGNAVEVIDGNGNATRNQYDRLNRLVATATNPADGNPNAPPAAPKTTDIVVANEYDDAGNLVKVTDGESHVTGFRYDGLARKTRTLWDEGSAVQRTEQATYDGVVQLTRVDPKNQTTTYQYDDLNRLADVIYGTGHADNRHYAYDLVGNLLTVTYPNETAARQVIRGVNQVVDKLDRLTEETSAGATHEHTYDKAGNRRTTEYASTGRTLASTYDKLNRLLTLTENGTSVTAYSYDINGNITRKTLPNGTDTRCTFDALNRKLSETSLKSGGAVVSSFDYSQTHGGYPAGYDNVGNVLKIVEQYGHASVNDRTVTNTYDHTYRLDVETIAEAGGSTTVTDYAHDKANNRTGKTVTVDQGTPTVWTFLYGPFGTTHNSNQLRSASDGTITTTFDYDLNGNRTTKKVNSVTTQTLTWDHENRLKQVVDSSLGTFEYAYDHRTRRVVRDESSASGKSTELSFSGGLSVQEYVTGSQIPAAELIRGSDYGGGIGGVLYTIRDGGTTRSFNAYNSRGDVVSQTDADGEIDWQASYEAFGKRTQQQGATLDRQRANTKDEDPWGGLNEGLRYRDLEFAVFLTRDPAGFVDGPNVYTYVRQNPWSSYDPTGLGAREVAAGIWGGLSTALSDLGHGIWEAATIANYVNPLGIAESAIRTGSLSQGWASHVDANTQRLEETARHQERVAAETLAATAKVSTADSSATDYRLAVVAGAVFFPEPGGKAKALGKLDEAAGALDSARRVFNNSKEAVAEIAGGSDELYEISQGVRRSKAAQILGHKEITARIVKEGQDDVIQQLPISSLRSPKEVIDARSFNDAERFGETLEKTRKAPVGPENAIEVRAGTRGTPIEEVRIQYHGSE